MFEFLSTVIGKITTGIVAVGLMIGSFFGINSATDNLGTTVPTVVAKFSTTLASEITSTATSMVLTSGTTLDGTTLNGTYGMVIDSGVENKEEFILAQCLDTVCSSLTRGVSAITGEDSVTALKHAHSRGASVKISDHPQLAIVSRVVNGDESFPNGVTIGGGVTTGNAPVFLGDKATYLNTETISDDKDLATKAYVDSAVVSGAANASTTAKGIVEEATDAELQAGTASGGTGARLFAGGASFTQTATANKVCVANSSGTLDDGWLGMTTAGDLPYSNGTSVTRLALGTSGYFLTAGASAPSWGGANLGEANTFFGATDLTGSEAEDLSDNGTTTIHTHSNHVDIAPVTITNVGTNDWEDLDLSASIPAGATTAEFLIYTTSATAADCGVRANGGSVARTVSLDTDVNRSVNMLVKLDANRVIDRKDSSGAGAHLCIFILTGYSN